MTDYRLQVKVKNNNILAAIESAGYATVGAFCAAHGLSQTAIGYLVNMKKSPMLQDGSWSTNVMRLSDILMVEPGKLFSNTQRTLQLKRNHAEKIYTETQMQTLMDDSPDFLLLKNEAGKVIDDAIHKALTPRQMELISLRFGLGGYKEHTLAELGDMYGLSTSWVRQIEASALRRLRHPENCEAMLELVQPS